MSAVAHVLARVRVGEVVRHRVVLRVLVKVRENAGEGLVWWQRDVRASRFEGNLLTSLSFSGDTGAPKKYCRFCAGKQRGRR